MTTLLRSLFLAGFFAAFYPLAAEEFGGIEFPQGEASFADVVVVYDPSFSGGAVPTHPDFTDPQEILGPPDYPGGNNQPGSVSLGSGGMIVVQFTNNVLTGSDDATPDLHIFEVGSDVEDTFVEVSANGIDWLPVGKVFGSVSSVDLDAYGLDSTAVINFVRLIDDPNEGNTTGDTVGADIDAVGAIATTTVQDNPQLEIGHAVVLRFQSALGSVYTIQESTTMEEGSWVDVLPGIVGDGTELEFFFEASDPRKFYRLKPPPEAPPAS